MKNLDPIVSSGVNGSDCLASGFSEKQASAGALKDTRCHVIYFPRLLEMFIHIFVI